MPELLPMDLQWHLRKKMDDRVHPVHLQDHLTPR